MTTIPLTRGRPQEKSAEGQRSLLGSEEGIHTTREGLLHKGRICRKIEAKDIIKSSELAPETSRYNNISRFVAYFLMRSLRVEWISGKVMTSNELSKEERNCTLSLGAKRGKPSGSHDRLPVGIK